MCTILFSWNSSPGYRLIMAANRDEFYARKTLPSHWWEDSPSVLAGKDLEAGGTWMGVTSGGKFAAITNYRKFPFTKHSTSRGSIVKDYLSNGDSPGDFLLHLRNVASQFDGFNLVFGNQEELFYFSNRGPEQKLEPSVYGLSNHLLDTPWPKVSKGKENFSRFVQGGKVDSSSMFELLWDEEKAEDHLLPDTGIGLEKERLLSSIFIKSPEYGTRISTLLLIDNQGQVTFHEKSLVPENDNKVEFRIPNGESTGRASSV